MASTNGQAPLPFGSETDRSSRAKATLTIPAGTQSGTKLRMKGKGVPDPKGGTPGDMYVHAQIAVPKAPDAKARKILEELKGIEVDPREG